MAWKPEESELARVRGARILLVDDTSIYHMVAMGIMSSWEVHLTFAFDGREALAKLSERDFDIILMDIEMPGMDGCQATTAIRQSDNFKTTPIIAMTSHLSTLSHRRFMSIGMDDFLSKPLDPKQVLRTLAKWIQNPNPQGTGKAAIPTHAQEESDTYMLPGAIEGVDLKEGLARCTGNRGFYARLLKEFRQEYRDAGIRLGELIAAGEVEVARRLAHTIKGVAGNLGMVNLASTASELEISIQKQINIPVSLANTQRAMDILNQGLDALDQDVSAPESAAENRDLKKAMALTGQLKAMLANGDFRSSDVAFQLHNALGGEHADSATAMKQATDRFEFDKALALLAELERALKA